MHLRRNNNNRNQDQQREQNEYFESAEVKVAAKAEVVFDWTKLTFPKEVRELAQQRKVLAKKMQEVDNRLRFGYSEPLYDYKMDLIKEDVELSCKMTEILVK